MNKKLIIDMLKGFKQMGFDTVKANIFQISINNTRGSLPLVLINNYGYMTPTITDWYSIDDEIKRLQDLKEEQ